MVKWIFIPPSRVLLSWIHPHYGHVSLETQCFFGYPISGTHTHFTIHNIAMEKHPLSSMILRQQMVIFHSKLLNYQRYPSGSPMDSFFGTRDRARLVARAQYSCTSRRMTAGRVCHLVWVEGGSLKVHKTTQMFRLWFMIGVCYWIGCHKTWKSNPHRRCPSILRHPETVCFQRGSEEWLSSLHMGLNI